MTTVREIMTGGPECIGHGETLDVAARKMVDLDAGALPICGNDDRLIGMLTDRDIVAKCLAVGGDPYQMTAGQLAQGVAPTMVDSSDDVDTALATMTDNAVRRLPVLEGGRLVGVVSQADIAVSLPSEQVGDLVESISATS